MKEKERSSLVRTGGHYVSLVGYGLDKDEKLNKNIFIIHNPSTSPKKPKREFLNLRPLAGYDGIRRNTTLKALNDEGKTKWSTQAEDKILLKKDGDKYIVLEAIIDFQIK